LQTAYVGLEDWKGVLVLAPPIMKQLLAAGDLGRFYIRHGENPFAALAHAGLGDFKTANRLISDSPLDCVRCVRLRGRIAALQRDWPTAEKWFRHAVALAPSIPFAYAEWGAALLRKGDTQGAIAKLAMARAKGPHFADPLEVWGEALMLENRSDLALGKFRDAFRYAPNWGRLHLKWGEALRFVGRQDEARNHFAIASGLALSSDERAELGKVLRPSPRS
jgi:tetratricopeptide (TPR) repeat protein